MHFSNPGIQSERYSLHSGDPSIQSGRYSSYFWVFEIAKVLCFLGDSDPEHDTFLDSVQSLSLAPRSRSWVPAPRRGKGVTLLQSRNSIGWLLVTLLLSGHSIQALFVALLRPEKAFLEFFLLHFCDPPFNPKGICYTSPIPAFNLDAISYTSAVPPFNRETICYTSAVPSLNRGALRDVFLYVRQAQGTLLQPWRTPALNPDAIRYTSTILAYNPKAICYTSRAPALNPNGICCTLAILAPNPNTI